MDLDVGLELPVLVLVVRNCANELLLIETRASSLLGLTQGHNLLLLVVAVSALGAKFTDYLENLGQLFLSEIHVHCHTDHNKVVLKDET